MIDLIGAPFDLCGLRVGSRLGPAALRLAGLAEALTELGFEVNDSRDLYGPVGSLVESTQEGGLRGPGGGTGGSGKTKIKEISPYLHLKASLSGLTEDQKVSGTNVNFSTNYTAFAPVLPDGHPGSGPEDLTHARLESFEVKVGTTPVQQWSYGQTSVINPGAPVLGGTVRFASTQFPPDTNITITFKGIFKIQKKKNAGTLIFEREEPVEETFTVKIYNHHSILANFWNGGNAAENPSTPGTAAAARLAGASGADSALTGMNHVREGSGSSYQMFSNQMATILSKSTVFVAHTHGLTSGITDSGNATVTWSSLGGYAQPAAPPFNLVMLYACSTLAGSGATGAPASFGISSGVIDRALVGFDKDVMAYYTKVNGDNIEIDTSKPISLHSDKVLEKLQIGWPLSIAVDEANDTTGGTRVSARIIGSSGEEDFVDAPAMLKGDGNTTLVKVYLTAAERAAGVSANWYLSYF